MCCSVRGDLLGAFASVSSKLEEAKARGDRSNKVLDSVLVETTGMADPAPIVRTLLQVPFFPDIVFRRRERSIMTHSPAVRSFTSVASRPR